MSIVQLDAPALEFTEHLLLQDNRRIIFSGRYGIGKSTFLKKYFEDHPEYFTVVVSPINYVITSNEDIFSLVKFDVLYDLLLQNRVELDMGLTESNKEKILQDMADLTKAVVGMFSTLGKSFYELSDQIIPLIDKINGWNEANETGGDVERIKEFVSKTETNHFLRGYDYVDDIINQSLKSIKDKEKILIIEDLDRIDPDHIFRLFNVFSAHLDWRRQQNGVEAKYEFDKIIFVCDIANIKSIFENRYGTGADFNGFIDKFYSTEVFSFDNKMAVIQWVGRFVRKLNSEIRIDAIALEFLIEILAGFVKLGIIGMRSLIKIERAFNHEVLYNHMNLHSRTRGAEDLLLFQLYAVLRMIVGEGNELYKRCMEAGNLCKQGLTRTQGSVFNSYQTYYLAAILPALEFNVNGLKVSETSYSQLVSGEGLSERYISYHLKDMRGYIGATINERETATIYLRRINFTPEEEWRRLAEAFAVIRNMINY